MWALLDMYKYFVDVCTDNNDNSFRESISKQRTFYQRFSELACFKNCVIIHLVRWMLAVKRPLVLPYFV